MQQHTQTSRRECGDTASARPTYLVGFSDDKALVHPKRQTLVRARDTEEMTRIAALLGGSCAVATSEAFAEEHPERADHAQRLIETPPSLAFPLDPTPLRETLRRIPLALGDLIGTGLALDDDDPLPAPIDRRYVHKKNAKTS